MYIFSAWKKCIWLINIIWIMMSSHSQKKAFYLLVFAAFYICKQIWNYRANLVVPVLQTPESPLPAETSDCQHERNKGGCDFFLRCFSLLDTLSLCQFLQQVPQTFSSTTPSKLCLDLRLSVNFLNYLFKTYPQPFFFFITTSLSFLLLLLLGLHFSIQECKLPDSKGHCLVHWWMYVEWKNK